MSEASIEREKEKRMKEVVSLLLSALFECNQFSDFSFLMDGFFPSTGDILEFLLRTVLFYDAFAEAPV